MPRITKPLNNTEVQQAKPKAKEYNLADGDGLMLRITPNAIKTWFFNYYHPFNKKRIKISFGKYPDLSLQNARKKRSEARELLVQNIDPKEHREKNQRSIEQAYSNTFEKVAADWFDVKKTKVTHDYAVNLWSSFQNHIFPNIGQHPISQITATNAIEIMKPIVAKGSLETVKRLCQRLNEVMTFAVNTGLIQHNPLVGIKQAFEQPLKQHMPTITPDELPNLMRAISIASIKLVTRYLIEWQLHTMVRPGEAVKARWSEIDFENSLWNIPAETMKKKRPHSVPLTKQILNLLESIKPISGHREYIFPADRNPRSHTNESTANTAIKRMGYKGKLVAHGLRSLASTTLNEQGFDPDVIESALSHVDDNEVRRAYNRADYLKRRVKIMDWWSEHIEKAATGNMSLSGSIKGLRVVG